MHAAARFGMILGLVLAHGAPAAQDPATHPIDLDLARQYFQEARSDSARDGGALWGIELYGPLVFADRGTRFVVANQADAEGLLQPAGDVFIGTLPETEGIANTKLRWAGVEWTMVMWPLPGNEGSRRQLMCHEMFHRIQDDLDLGLGIPDNAHLDEHEGRLWMRLEWRALRSALETAGDERRQAIEDALRFRAVRQARFSSRADDECVLELNEGLAEYTGMMAGRPEKADRVRAAIAFLDRYDRHPNFVRSFAYASGPAYGLLIDERIRGWTRDLNKSSDLGRVLAEAYEIRLSRGTDESIARERFSPYDGDTVLAEENERRQAHLEQQAAFEGRFVTGARLVLPVTEFPSYTFDPNGIKSFAGRGARGNVYLTTRVVGEWGILDVTAGGALFVMRGDDIVRIVVPAPADAGSQPLVGDGYTLQLKDGWTLRKVGTRGNYIARETR